MAIVVPAYMDKIESNGGVRTVGHRLNSLPRSVRWIADAAHAGVGKQQQSVGAGRDDQLAVGGNLWL